MTAPTDDCLNPENKKMTAVSYVKIFAFHPHLHIDRVIIERSFGHSNLQLCSLNYLTNEQLKFKDINLLKQLRNCALSVASKRNKRKRTTKISKFTLKLYAFVYQRIMKFPQNKFEFETVATNDLFENIHKIINVKVHLHHSHVTGEVIGYAHDFCNLKVRENKDVISCIAHNFFGFDIYFFLKAIRLSAWKTKDINISGTGLTNVSFASIDQLKLIDMMKYFQTCLGKLAETLSADEKTCHSKINSATFNYAHSFFESLERIIIRSKK